MATLSVLEIDPADALVRHTRACLTEAATASFDRTRGFYAIEGMSGARYRRFINALLRRLGPVAYLEVGTWLGSTLCAAIHGNAVRALAIDDWSQFGGPREACLANIAAHRTAQASVELIERDFRGIDFASLPDRFPRFSIYLFDGPHEAQDQYDGLVHALPALAETFVYVCDDWNWWQVRAGTTRAIEECGLEILFLAEIRTSLDNSHGEPAFGRSDWHNGYCIAVLRKPSAGQCFGAAAVPSSALPSPERDALQTLRAENAALRRQVARLELRNEALRHLGSLAA
jgi:hypothetical protein